MSRAPGLSLTWAGASLEVPARSSWCPVLLLVNSGSAEGAAGGFRTALCELRRRDGSRVTSRTQIMLHAVRVTYRVGPGATRVLPCPLPLLPDEVSALPAGEYVLRAAWGGLEPPELPVLIT